MAQEDPALWQIEPRENFLNQHLLFRGINKQIWKHWGEDIDNIQENFITFPRKSDIKPELSVDWSKFCHNPKNTLIRLFLTSYIKKNKTPIPKVLQDLGITIYPSKYDLSIDDLEIPEKIVMEARKENGIIRFQIGELIKLIEDKQLPINIRHDPIKKTDEINLFLNHSHSIIEGFSKTNFTKIRTILSDIAKWCNDFKPIIK